jgi:hypothetical protein
MELDPCLRGAGLFLKPVSTPPEFIIGPASWLDRLRGTMLSGIMPKSFKLEQNCRGGAYEKCSTDR